MDRNDWFAPKWSVLRKFAAAAALGLLLAAAGSALQVQALALVGVLAIVPLIFWLAFIPVLHWRERYVGTYVGVWGGFLVFETSSWSKLVYWFRHVLPDWRRTGRYHDIR